jgi:predicted HicB family RNase H-like nuclease
MKKKNKKETLNFRVSAEFKERLIEEAGKERRSLTNYLENTLTKLWDERDPSISKIRDAKRN